MGLVTVQSILETKPIAARQSSGPETGPGTIRQAQADFFDERPPLYPWPSLLRKAGLRRVCKPREAFWHKALDQLRVGPADRLLDVGCGTGIWLERIARQYGAEATGIDISRKSLRKASVESAISNSMVCGDVVNLPIASNVYDAILTLDVLEHVDRQIRCLSEMTRVLKPGGRLLVWTINRRQAYTWNWLLAKVGIDVFDRVAHDPALLPDPGEVCTELELQGVTVERVELFNSFFTLAVDEAIMVVVSILEKLGLFDRVGRLSTFLGVVFLSLTDLVSRTSWRVLHWLDGPWRGRGYSNGFLILGRKLASIQNPVKPSSASSKRRLDGRKVL